MSYPAYVIDQKIYPNIPLSKCAVLLTTPQLWVVPYDVLDETAKRHLDQLVTANGGTLPLSSVNVTKQLLLDNGASWYDVYIGVTKYVNPTSLGTPGNTSPSASSISALLSVYQLGGL